MPQESELSILLIEDDPDAARLIQHVLTKATGTPVAVESAGDLHTGLERLATGDFQAVLLDLNLPDSSGFDTFACIRQKAPDRAVIVLTGQEDEALALQAVRAGADEYLIKSEIRERFLVQRIRHAVERNRLKLQDSDKSVKNGRIFSFIGAKGGVGTTTLVVNLAAALAHADKTSLAIELVGEYGSFGTLLNRSPLWNLSTVVRSAPEQISREAVASCLEDLGKGFRALCGPERGEGHGPISPEQARALLGAARTMADFTIVDLPWASAPLVEEVMQHSTFTALVVERNRIGLHAALAKMTDLQSMTTRPDSVGAVVVNKTPFIEFLSPSEFGKRLGCGVLGVVPPAADMCVAGEFEPLPIESHPETPFSVSIQELARRLNAGSIRFVTP